MAGRIGERPLSRLAVRRRPPWCDHPWMIVLGGAAALGSLALLVISVRLAPWDMIDLHVYHWGGDTAWNRSDVYDLFDTKDANLQFTYTPTALLLFMGMSKLAITPLTYLVTIGSVIALAASVWMALGLAAVPRRAGLTLLISAVVLWLEPLQQTLGFGQIDLLLMLMVMADLSLDDRRRGKGVLIGLATGVKLVPGIFILYLLVTRRFRAALVSAATVAATVGLGFALLPQESHRYWIDGLFSDSSRVGSAAYVGDQSLQGLMDRILKDGVMTDRPYWLVVAVVVAAAGLALAAMAHRRGDELLGVATTALVGLLVSPISWSHHWVWIAVVLTAMVVYALRAKAERPVRSAVAWALVGAVLALFAAYPMSVEGRPTRPMGLIWSVPFRNGREFHWRGLAHPLLGNLYVLVGLVLLGCAVYATTEGMRIARK